MNKEIKIQARGRGADDNICENSNCDNCKGCAEYNNYFKIISYETGQFQIEYYHKKRNKIINVFSEQIDLDRLNLVLRQE